MRFVKLSQRIVNLAQVTDIQLLNPGEAGNYIHVPEGRRAAEIYFAAPDAGGEQGYGSISRYITVWDDDVDHLLDVIANVEGLL